MQREEDFVDELNNSESLLQTITQQQVCVLQGEKKMVIL